MSDLEIAFKEYREAANNVIGELLRNVEDNKVEAHKAAIACIMIEKTGNSVADLLDIKMEVNNDRTGLETGK